jgi:PA14 domain
MSSHSSRAALALLVSLAVAQIACVETEGDAVFTPWDAQASSGPACGGADPPLGRLSGRVYPVPFETRRLPSFDAQSPVGTICMDRLDVGWRKGYPGFPGLQDRFEWFAIDFQGGFVVERPGLYSFRLSSDDGSRLYLDGALVLDNDGYHDIRTVQGSVLLTAGPHHIAVPFWQGPGPLALILEVAAPGEAYHVFHLGTPLGGALP